MRALDKFSTDELVAEVVRRGFTLRDLAPLVCVELPTKALAQELRRRQASEQEPESRSAQAKSAAQARWKKPPDGM